LWIGTFGNCFSGRGLTITRYSASQTAPLWRRKIIGYFKVSCGGERYSLAMLSLGNSGILLFIKILNELPTLIITY
jgi:hypothetical protein